MKFNSFNLMAVLVALPAAVQACDLRLEWVSNWSEAALRRYRVTLITTPQDDSQLGIFCDQLGQTSVMASNVQCFWEDGRFLADTSFQEGSVGHGYVFSHRRHLPLHPLATVCASACMSKANDMGVSPLPNAAAIANISGLSRKLLVAILTYPDAGGPLIFDVAPEKRGYQSSILGH